MTESELKQLRESFDSDYESSEFELEDSVTIPDLDDLAQGRAARIEDVGYLFFDLRGFTTWADKKRDKTVFKVLDPTFRLLVRIARKHDGFVEKFTGDGLMVVLGADEPERAQVALHALECGNEMGIAMQEIVNPFMLGKKHAEDAFRWGAGVEMGQGLIAKMGIRGHLHLNSISRAANHASKAEDAAGDNEVRVGKLLHTSLPAAAQALLTLAGPVQGEDTYAFRPSKDKSGNWISVLATASMSAAASEEARQIYSSLSRGERPRVTASGTLSTQGGVPVKDHRWHGPR